MLETPKTIKLQPHNKPHTCRNCGNQFSGKVCNICGEKVFHHKQLSIHHFFHQWVDLFTHFENKVLKSIWLTMRKPGFITNQNLQGIRVPYAKPVQLFIVVNLVFYLALQHFTRVDYSPTAGDTGSNTISAHKGFEWAQPLDSIIVATLDSTRERKLRNYDLKKLEGRSYSVYRMFGVKDTSFHQYGRYQKEQLFYNAFDQKMSFFSKTLIFLLIPIIGGIFYLFFYKKLQHFGSALILSTHFITFNLLFFILLTAASIAPLQWFGSRTFYKLPYKLMDATLYSKFMKPFSEAVFGLWGGFEAYHVIFWGIWLFMAFKRLFNLHWLQNVLVSYLLARLFISVIFVFYKKFLIAFTLWNL